MCIRDRNKKRTLGTMHAQELAYKFKSKEDIYVYLDKHCQFYLPPRNQVNKDFLKLVFVEEKRLLHKTEVDPIEVPHYDELSVKALWPQFAKDKNISPYFPDSFAADKGPARKYFFDILNTKEPE